MLYFKKIIGDLDAEIRKLELTASASRFPTIGDHDYIVGQINGLKSAKDLVLTAKNEMETIDDIDEDEDREFSTETRKNVGRRIS